MESFKKQDNLKPYFETAHGFAVFDTIAKGGIGIGGAIGNGNVYINHRDNTETLVGTSNMLQVSFGFQFGGQVYSEIIFFETERDHQNFTAGNFEFGADANVVALTASASAKIGTLGNQGIQAGLKSDDIAVTNASAPGSIRYTKGMAVFTITKGGLMYEATISGQKFNFTPASASVATTATK